MKAIFTLFDRKTTIWAIILATLYYILATYLQNPSLIVDTLTGHYPLAYRLNIQALLLVGSPVSLSPVSFALLMATSLLTGANLSLLLRYLSFLREQKLPLVIGSTTLISLAGAGCAACGLPILALLGLTGSLVYLPFQGQEISFVAVVLLFISFIFLTRSLIASGACKLNK